VTNVAKNTQDAWGRAFKGMEDALVSFIQTGKLDFTSLANSIIADLIRIQVQQNLMGPLARGFMGLFGGGTSNPAGGTNNSAGGGMSGGTALAANGAAFGFADGGQFSNGLYSSPTPFAFASGNGFNLGVMGEAGPEAVMPLTRGADGKLGVRMQGGGASIVLSPTTHITIDSRTDAGQINKLVRDAVQQGNAQLVDRLQRRRMLG
jgi:lambda family phage tail tape measure protein